MDPQTKRLVNYCLKKHLISAAQLRELKRRCKDKTAGGDFRQALCAYLGWDQKQYQQIWARLASTIDMPAKVLHSASPAVGARTTAKDRLSLQKRSPGTQMRKLSSIASASSTPSRPTADISTQDSPRQGQFASQSNHAVKSKKLAPTLADLISARRSPLGQRQKFGHYMLLEEVAAGGMGRIYKAYHAHLQRHVALKIMLSGQLAESDQKERFLREARLTMQLNHPHIIRIYDVGIHAGHPYIVMDFIVGRTLAAAIKKDKLSPRRVLTYFVAIADALAYAHTQGIIHRDIKPSNIMITTEEKPILMDFGIARKIEDSEGQMTRTGQVIGSPQYMSPEQARGEKLDGRSDIYSLGVTLYEALSSHTVVSRGNVMTILHQVTHEEVTPLSQHVPISQDIETICMKCLEKEPAKRYQTMEALRDDMQRFLAGEPILARPLTALERLWRYAQRHRHVLLVILLLVGTIAILLPTWSYLARQHQIRQLLACARQYLEQQRYPEARLAWSQVQLLDNTNPAVQQGLKEIADQQHASFKAAQAALRNHDWHAATKIYNQILEHDRGNKKAALAVKISELLEQAFDALQKNKYKKARVKFQQVQVLDKSNPIAKDGLKTIKSLLGALFKKAQEEVTQGHWKAGEELYKEIRQRDPDNHRARLQHTRLRHNWAVTYYQQALELYNNPGLRRTDMQKCLQLLHQAVARDHYFAEAFFIRGQVYQRMAYYCQAQHDYRRALKLNPNLVAARYYLALINPDHIKLPPHSDEADSRPFVRLLRAYRIYAKKHHQPVRHSSDIHDYRRALQICHEVAQEYPLLAAVHFLKAKIYEDLSWILLRPSDDEADRCLVMEAIDHAFRALKRGLELNPANGEAYFARGNIYLTLRNFNQALEDFEKALDLGFADFELYYHRAFCLLCLQEYDETIRNLQILINREHRGKVWQAYYLLHVVYALRHQYKRALQILDTCRPKQDHPNKLFHILYFFSRTLLLCLMQDAEQARRDLQCWYNYMCRVENLRNLINSRFSATVLQRCVNTLLDPFAASVQEKQCIPMALVASQQMQDLGNKIRLQIFSYRQVQVNLLLPMTLQHILKNLQATLMVLNVSRRVHLNYSVITIMQSLLLMFRRMEEQRCMRLQSPLSAQFYYHRAAAFYYRRLWPQALSDLNKALDMDSQNPRVHYALATVYSLLASRHPDYGKQSLYHLKRALECGWQERRYLQQDPDFRNVRQLPGFATIVRDTRPNQWYRAIVLQVQQALAAKQYRRAIRILQPYQTCRLACLQSLRRQACQGLTNEMCRQVGEWISRHQERKLHDLLNTARRLLTKYHYRQVMRAAARACTQEGQRLESKNQEQRAWHFYEQALEYDPQCWQAYYYKGKLRKRQKRGPKASQEALRETLVYWEEACLFCPDSKMAQELSQGIEALKKSLAKHQ